VSLCGSRQYLSKIIDTPVNGRPSLFRVDSVHQMVTSLSVCWSIDTKSMRKSIATIDTIEHVLNVANSYLAYWRRLHKALKSYIHTYHSRFIPEGVVEVSQIFPPYAHVLSKLFSNE
jgi:hypothetical protein